MTRESRASLQLDKLKKEMKDKEKEVAKLSLIITKRDQEAGALRQKIQELEDTIGDQEVEHDEMVAKLAQSLDVLAKRKPRTSKRAVQPAETINIDSLDEKFQNTSLANI